MAIFSFGKKKKKEEPSAPGSPIEQIMIMKQRGMDNNQISIELEKQGYNSSQIIDSLKQANLTGPIPTPEEPQGYDQQYQEMPQQQPPNYPPPEPQEPPEPSISNEEIEEIAEAIIDEKWKEFEVDVKAIIDWKNKTDVRINKLDQQIKDLATSLNGLHKNLLNKISDYDKNIMDVGTEIKAMEKVFQKILPNLTENVNKLERMAKSPKSGKK